MKTVCSAVFALLIVAPIPSQGRTWIVDFANGTGADFTDLPPAIAAATDGDLIRVRPGLYTTAPIVNKALVILGGAGVQTWLPSQPFAISQLAAGKQVVLAGIDNSAAVAAVTLTANQGRVLLARMTLGNVVVTDCASVQLNGCRLQGRSGLFTPGAPALEVTRSTVAASGCELRGVGTHSPSTSSPGLVALDAGVTLAACIVSGGGGGEVSPNMPGIITTNSELRIAGDASAVVESGQTAGVAPAIRTSGGRITLDPAVTVRGFQSPAITGTATVAMTWLPSLRATGAAPGGIANAELFSPAGDLLLWFASLAADPIDAGPAGTLWLDPGRFLLVAIAVQGASGHTSMPTPVPNDPLLRFAAWSQQVLSGTPTGGWRLSNPATFAFF